MRDLNLKRRIDRKYIIETGVCTPEKSLISLVRKRADSSFTSSVGDDISEDQLPPCPLGYRYDLSTAIALRMQGCVDPHKDEWQGAENPPKHINLFWLIDCNDPYVHLMVEDEYACLYEHRFAFFDDKRLHALTANRVWVGIAVQAGCITTENINDDDYRKQGV